MCFWRRWQVKRGKRGRYPKRILPTVKYVVSINVDILLAEVRDFVVSRRIKGSIEENTCVFAGQRRLRVEALGSIPNMSLNLLGGKFIEKRHNRFRQVGEAAEEWHGERILMKSFIGKFEVVDNCSAVAFRGKDLHRVAVPYKKAATRAEKDKLKSRGIDLDRFVDGSVINHEGLIKLEHKPTMLNYWHMVLDLFPQEAELPIKRDDAAWKKNMIGFVVQEILTVKYEIDPDPVPTIHKGVYCKQF